MTARQLFEYALIELNKEQAPSLLLEDYNYYINKSINQYINKIYNLYDINQQKSDDLRVLKATAILTPTVSNDFSGAALFNKTYEVDLPDDYLHVLNCLVEYNVKKSVKCYDLNDSIQFGAKRLTSDIFAQIVNNHYMRPSYRSPYYFINNVNTQNTYPTDDSQVDIVHGVEDPAYRVAENRYGNKSKVRLEIRYGKDNSVFELSKVYVDYIKAPQFIRLTMAQVDATSDTSQVLEFPDYVCQEIVNELIHLLLEAASDQRLQSHIPINQSIANPAQEQQKR